jgi:hypothetical protein
MLHSNVDIFFSDIRENIASDPNQGKEFGSGQLVS